MDIAKLSIAELRKLNKRIETELKKRDDSAKRDLLKKMQRLAAEHGLSIDDVVGKTAAPSKPRSPSAAKSAGKPKGKKIVVAPKYRNPDDASMTWTGRGRKPLWVQKWLDDGKVVDELLIR
ncbi:MAG: H-NS histone family protein [Rhodocyclaceae bacterium]|nr:H-NS histone family protein [Rhodocyclaceae bacterium]